jgi:glutathione S-transferase
MIKIYQAEWCPTSHRVRQRLTELQVPFIAIQVSVDPVQRGELQKISGQNMIPAVVLEDGTVLTGKSKEIIAGIDKVYPEHSETEAHIEKDKENYPFHPRPK